MWKQQKKTINAKVRLATLETKPHSSKGRVMTKQDGYTHSADLSTSTLSSFISLQQHSDLMPVRQAFNFQLRNTMEGAHHRKAVLFLCLFFSLTFKPWLWCSVIMCCHKNCSLPESLQYAPGCSFR